MKVFELMEASYSGRRIWRHRGTENYGLRVEVTKEERIEIVKRISEILRRRDREKDDSFSGHYPVVWTSPEQATTFPADIRFVIHRSDDRFERQSMAGELAPRLLKSAIKKVFKEVLGVEVSVTLERDHDANGLRYIDTKVSWAGRYDK